jgi:UDP-glucuronate decarboxylase
VYGDPSVHPQPEEYWGHVNPIGPRSCYDEGKRCAETLFFDYRRQHDLGIKVARLFNTYGPRMQPDDGRVVSNFIMQALSGESLTVYGDGSQTRSFCFVDDTVEALIRLMATGHEVTGPINIGNPHEIEVGELAERVSALVNPANEVVYLPLPLDDPHRRRPNIDRARELLDWEPRVPLADGLARTVAWFTSEYGADRDAGERAGWVPELGASTSMASA